MNINSNNKKKVSRKKYFKQKLMAGASERIKKYWALLGREKENLK